MTESVTSIALCRNSTTKISSSPNEEAHDGKIHTTATSSDKAIEDSNKLGEDCIDMVEPS